MAEGTISSAATLTGWRKSSYSDNEGGDCIEVLDGHPHGIPVRDSKAPRGPVIVVPAGAWSAFVDAVKGGAFGEG
ncbi:DUF397 domain-containing protein [Streptomyces noursei]|uniref:DUF397 domain-containing protein n=1 Tax=Streptomyces noursei TaxID=1971 RepID=UPI0016785D16|nr:DUF397 domain-containing protein [Streptomyces noursei]MCZ1017094.1 DUF397 domain-containing protein [Streptomyces noursei]GGX10676.1 hypothetical protein GCM10010341_35170 [Streptomyces noursei]